MSSVVGAPPSPAPRTVEPEVFRTRTAAWLAGIAAVSLLAGMVVRALSGELTTGQSVQANALSRSAIGHDALSAFLESAGVTVVVSRHGSAAKAGPSAPLLVLEPVLLEAGDTGESGVPTVYGLRELVDMALARGAAVVLVLPKWQGVQNGARPDWVGGVEPWPRAEVARVLTTALGHPAAEDAAREPIVRPPKGELGAWSGALAAPSPTLDYPQLLDAQQISASPSRPLEAITETPQGVLLAKVRGERIWVLSDPDVLNTYGLGRGDNAQFVHAALIGQLEPQTLVLDTTLQGLGQPPSLWRDLLTPPLLLVTLHVGLLFSLAAWLLAARYGKPRKLPPRVAPGKRVILDATAELLEASPHGHESLPHYFHMSVRRAAIACALPAGLPEQEQLRRLEEIARSRGLEENLHELRAEATSLVPERYGKKDVRLEQRCLTIARRVHRFAATLAHGRRVDGSAAQEKPNANP